MWPPSVPGRGAFSFTLEKITLSAGVGLYIIHLFFCVDLHFSALVVILKLRRVVSEQTESLRESRRSYLARVVSGKNPPNISARYTTQELITMARGAGILTKIVGYTLLYPLTILSILILSRLSLFDNWTMTPSLTITFGIGGLILLASSIVMLTASRSLGAAIKKEAALLVAQQERASKELKKDQAKSEADRESAVADLNVDAVKREYDWLEKYKQGSFAPWYQQPIFTALLGGLAIFGSIGVAEPLFRMLVP